MPEYSFPEEYALHEQDYEDFAAVRASFEWPSPATFNMADALCDQWADERYRLALVEVDEEGRERRLSFRQLQRAASNLADFLAGRGVGRGDRVGITSPQTWDTLVAHVAVWKLGAVAVPLSPQFGTDALRYRLSDCEATAVVITDANAEPFRDVRPELPAIESVVAAGDADAGDDEIGMRDALAGQSDTFDTAATDPDDDALIQYTSGTTGDPKGVVHGHRVLLGLLPFFSLWCLNLDRQPDDFVWTPAEWAWMGSFSLYAPSLAYGIPVLAYYSDERFDPATAFRLLDEHEVSIFLGPPTALRMMMQVENPAQEFDTSTLRTIPTGSEPVTREIFEWAEETFDDTAVHEAFGQTEAHGIITNCTALAEVRPGHMGVEMPGHRVELLDPQTGEQTVEPGEIGELALRYPDDPVCLKEYWNDPEATDGKVRDGWLLTGDLARVDGDGYYTYVTRKDHLIVSSGYRISPETVEECLTAHEAVADAAVVGVSDDERGEVPKAFVVLAEGHEPAPRTRTDLKDLVKERLASYEYPREIEFVDRLPRTTTGKVRRTELVDH